MTRYRFWISAAILALCCVNLTQAQRAVVAPRVSSVRAHAAPSYPTMPSRASGRSATTPAYRRSGVLTNNFFGTGFGLFGPFPGLGFNFGANQDWAIKAAIDPATQWRLFEAQKVFRNIGFGAPGFYLLDAGAYDYPPAEASEAEQAPPEQGVAAEQETAVRTYAEQPAQSAPLEDVGQFILALRNGSQVEAVAFTRANDHIIYVTADGFRRSLSLSDLDPDATVKINEERGTPLEIPL